MNTSQIGTQGEEQALQFLLKQGCKLLARNYRVKGGEIDLIVYDKNTLVFAEVKTRASQAFGGPFAAITPAKQKRIALAAALFIKTNRPKFDSIRFDAIAVLPQGVTHIKNAFTPARTLL